MYKNLVFLVWVLVEDDVMWQERYNYVLKGAVTKCVVLLCLVASKIEVMKLKGMGPLCRVG